MLQLVSLRGVIKLGDKRLIYEVVQFLSAAFPTLSYSRPSKAANTCPRGRVEISFHCNEPKGDGSTGGLIVGAQRLTRRLLA